MKPERIPLFPLEVVLFPAASLPLHIFEPRYKLMIERCLAHQLEFGVVLARPQGIVRVGCTAAILEVVKKYEDGQMDILTLGRNPFRVKDVMEDQAYLEGAVEYLEDAQSPSSREIEEQLLGLYQQCHKLLFHRDPETRDTRQATSLAYQIAGELPLDLGFKQELLELRAEAERQTHLLERLNQWLPHLNYLDRMRGKAGGNGHGTP